MIFFLSKIHFAFLCVNKFCFFFDILSGVFAKFIGREVKQGREFQCKTKKSMWKKLCNLNFVPIIFYLKKSLRNSANHVKRIHWLVVLTPARFADLPISPWLLYAPTIIYTFLKVQIVYFPAFTKILKNRPIWTIHEISWQIQKLKNILNFR